MLSRIKQVQHIILYYTKTYNSIIHYTERKIEMKLETTATRLKTLREKARYSHERLRIMLEEKYEIKISIGSLKNYEVSEQPHSHYGAVKHMRANLLCALADFYNVSTDYILGYTGSESTDIKERQITNKIGLSQKSIKNLSQLYSGKLKSGLSLAYAFDYMLSNRDFVEAFPHRIFDYFEQKEKEFVAPLCERDTDIADMARYFIIRQVERLIDDFYNDFIRPMHEGKQKPGQKRKEDVTNGNNTKQNEERG